MKKFLALVMIAGFMGTAGFAVASESTTGQHTAKKDLAVAIKSSAKAISQSFSGKVEKTKKGLVLETKNGKYQLKGLSLVDVVGKKVHVIGVVREDKGLNTIYVVKAEVNS